MQGIGLLHSLTVAALLFSAAGSSTSGEPTVDRRSAERVVVSSSAHDWNTTAWDQSKILSVGQHRYTAWWNQNGRLVLSRMEITSGTVESLTFPDEIIDPGDAHRNIALGVCLEDGTLHMAFDHHRNLLNWRRSTPGFLQAPPPELELQAFSDTSSMIGDDVEAVVTYPRFVTHPNGALLFVFRSGRAGDGDTYLQKYQSTDGSWQRLGKLIDRDGLYPPWMASTSRSAYLHDLVIDDSGRFHLSWVFREAGGSWDANHDIHYAYSDDGGILWRNNHGVAIADLDIADAIQLDDPGLVVATIPTGSWLMNQGAMTLDGDRQPHLFTLASTVITEDPKQRNLHYLHIWRASDGTWSSDWIDDPAVERYHDLLRGDLVFDAAGTLLAWFADDGVLYGASADAGSGWLDWEITPLAADRIDGQGLKADRGRFARDGALEVPLDLPLVHAGSPATGYAVQGIDPVGVDSPTAPMLGGPRVTGTGVELEWRPGPGNTSFDIVRRPVGGAAEVVAAGLGIRSMVRSYVDTEAIPGSTYAYRVLAQGRSGGFVESNEVLATVPLTAVTEVPPEADTYVRSGTASADNFGAQYVLAVARNTTRNEWRSLLRFSVPAAVPLPTSRAVLSLAVRSTGNHAVRTVRILGLEDDVWQEFGVTWDSAPAAGLDLGSLQIPVADEPRLVERYEIDVTPFVNAAAANGAVSFRLDPDGGPNPEAMVSFWSAEAPPVLRPTLIFRADADTDLDTVPDHRDLCMFVADPQQIDNDHDRWGDPCDPDDDNDGITDAIDNCPVSTNATQTDADGDGWGDVCDLPCDLDRNLECAAPDIVEILLAAADPAHQPAANPDLDGDGFIDGVDVELLLAALFDDTVQVRASTSGSGVRTGRFLDGLELDEP